MLSSAQTEKGKTMTTESKGYTIAGLAARLQKAERAWIAYTAAQILAMTRGTKKTVLATKVFGQDKPSSTYRNCWSLAEKVFASTFADTHRKAVVELGLDEALAYVQKVLDQHMMGLKVTNQKDYTALAHFTSVEDMPAVEPEPVEPDAVESAAKRQPEATDKTEAERSPTDHAIAVLSGLNPEELNVVAKWLADRMVDLDETEQLQLAA
ncbi:hypothetical protein ABGN05_27190 [Aquibium sp. LZ166]|uniref:DUF3102 domain-containing protein n=1 Tax=Aquibium pacificus TaxID=3153579 RepID=A0ABV3SRA8_9HYPH